jgi:uncharacterized protein YybS (DUF2232 family)
MELAVAGLIVVLGFLSIIRWGYPAVALPVLGAVAGAIVSGSLEAVQVFAAAAISGVTAGIAFREKKSIQFYILVSSFIMGAMFIVVYLVQAYQLGSDPIEKVRELLLAALTGSGMKQVEMDQMKEKIGFTIRVFKVVFPFLFVLQGMFFSFIAFSVMNLAYRLYRREKAEVKGLEFFRLSDYLVFVLIISLAGVVFIKDSISVTARLVSLNVLLVMTLLYFVQALGVLKHFLLKMRVPVIALPILFLILLSIQNEMIIAYSVMVLAACGALDLWADFRKLAGGPDETPDGNLK